MRRFGVIVALVCVLGTACGAHGGSRTDAVQQSKPARGPRPPTFADVVARVRTGIVRIETTGCREDGIGTGFLVGAHLVATVQHVVDGATSIALKQNGKVVAHGTVVGADPARDLALIRADRSLAGHHFVISDRPPRLGEDVAAMGFPLGLPLTVTRGSVSGMNRTIPIEGVARRRLVQTDAAVNPGNSGGPLITDGGNVVGLVDLGTAEANGLAFAVSASVAGPLIAAWRAAPQPVSAPACEESSPPASAAPPPAGGGSTSSSDVLSYDGRDFTIGYPAGFDVVSAEVDKGGYLDTTIESGDLLIRVDEDQGAPKDVDSAAAPVLAALRRQRGYNEISLGHVDFQGFDALRWEFEVVEQGVLLHKVDMFFIGSGSEWAILTQARAADYADVADAFDAIRNSFSAR